MSEKLVCSLCQRRSVVKRLFDDDDDNHECNRHHHLPLNDTLSGGLCTCNHRDAMYTKCEMFKRGRGGGLMLSASDSRSIVFFGKILCSHSASIHPGV